MSHDMKLAALEADVVAARQRLDHQVKADPDHEVAIAMYRADLRRAKLALEGHVPSYGPKAEPVRRYVDGRITA